MGTEKRERQKANRQKRLEEAAVAEQRDERRSKIIKWGSIAAAVVVFIVGYSFLTGDDDGGGTQDVAAGEVAPAESDTDPTGDTTTETALDADEDPTAATETTLGGDEDPTAATEASDAPGSQPCPAEDGSSERQTAFDGPQPDCLADGADYGAVITTSMGEVTIDLDEENAPNTVNNFVTLARYHYYDGVSFHQIGRAHV